MICEGAASKVAWDKTPGYPLNLTYATNDDVRRSMYDELIDCCVARLHLWLRGDVVVGEDPFEELQKGMFDPSSVFIKAEPHPDRKIREGKYRCISPVSLVDQIVEKSLFDELSKGLELYSSGSAIGIGFTDRQMKETIDFYTSKTSILGPPISDDVSGFDALHTPQVLQATWEIDNKNVDFQGRDPSGWRVATQKWVRLSCISLSAISGLLYRKLSPGMLNSGSADTSRRNTLLRTFYAHYLAAIIEDSIFNCAAGDDCTTWGITNQGRYEQAAKAAGITLRDVKYCSDTEFSFCSHTYDVSNHTAALDSWAKAVYKIASSPQPVRGDCMQTYHEVRYNEPGLVERVLAFINARAPLE